MNWPQGLPSFYLTKDLVEAIDRAEAIATVDLLQKMNLAQFPYPAQTLSFDVDDYFRSRGWCIGPATADERAAEARYESGPLAAITCLVTILIKEQEVDPNVLIEMSDGAWIVVDLLTNTVSGPKGVARAAPLEHFEIVTAMMGSMMALFLAALATKNTVQHTTHNPRAARGHGKGLFKTRHGAIYISRTVVDAPKVYNETGRRMPVHLRRGHIHRWLKGDGSHSVKFLPSIWVNAKMGGTPRVPEYEVHS